MTKKRKTGKAEAVEINPQQTKKYKGASQLAIDPEKIEVVTEIEETFADPTYDITFKMLFSNDQNKDILISLLNNLLNFTGDDTIEEVDINSPDLQKESASGVKGAVDVLCTTKGNQKIAVEMQRQYKEYFLSRTQEYMAKIISNQVMDGQSDDYHNAVKSTYVLVIGKQNIFRGKKYEISKNDTLFEKTVVPMIVETNVEVPGNKMHWKFYELPRFTKQYNDDNLDRDSELKLQWLNFLSSCSKKEEIPENIDEIISKGYKIMKTANWDADTRTLYWKQKADEASEIREAQALQEEMFEQGLKQGIEQGKLKGEIKGEISKIKTLFDLDLSQEQIIPKLKFLAHEKVKDKLEENLAYIQGHLSEPDSDICDELGLVGDLLES